MSDNPDSQPVSPGRVVGLSLFVIFLAGFTFPWTEIPFITWGLLLLYVIFPFRQVARALRLTPGATGLACALGLAVLQPAVFILGAWLIAEIPQFSYLSSTWYAVGVLAHAFLITVFHAIVYLGVYAGGALERRLAAPPKIPPPEKPPPEIELGEKPGWDEGGKPGDGE